MGRRAIHRTFISRVHTSGEQLGPHLTIAPAVIKRTGLLGWGVDRGPDKFSLRLHHPQLPQYEHEDRAMYNALKLGAGAVDRRERVLFDAEMCPDVATGKAIVYTDMIVGAAMVFARGLTTPGRPVAAALGSAAFRAADAYASQGTDFKYVIATVVAHQGGVRASAQPAERRSRFGRKRRAAVMEASAADATENATDTYTLQQDNGRLMETIPVDGIRAGVRERVLIMPQVELRTFADHLRLMWPEPLAESDIEVLVDGEIAQAPLPLRSLREGRVGAHIAGVRVPCLADATWSASWL